jgi:hypothetical protein
MTVMNPQLIRLWDHWFWSTNITALWVEPKGKRRYDVVIHYEIDSMEIVDFRFSYPTLDQAQTTAENVAKHVMECLEEVEV